MSKRLMILAGVVLAVALVGVAVVVPAFAHDPTPTPPPEAPFRCHGRGFGFGWGVCGQAGLEPAAEVLGMTADELSTQLWGGRTLADLADKAGVDLQTVRDVVEAACEQAMRDAIEQAVEDGYLTQEQADWLLEGMDLGFMPGRWGRGFGRGMRGGFGSFAPFSAPSVAPSSSSL